MPAKYTLLNEPAIQRMLHEERIAALEKALTLIDVQLMRADQTERRDYFLAKRRQAEKMLARARRAASRRAEPGRSPVPGEGSGWEGALPEPVEGTPVPFDRLKERAPDEGSPQ